MFAVKLKGNAIAYVFTFLKSILKEAITICKFLKKLEYTWQLFK